MDQENKKFSPRKFDVTLELKEIISMDKIKGNSLDIEYLEDKLRRGRR
jgi:hypothetical protein